MKTPRKKRHVPAAAIGLTTVLLLGQGGCVMGTEFRATALPAIESGVDQIVNGLMDGIFAAIAVDSTSDTDSTS